MIASLWPASFLLWNIAHIANGICRLAGELRPVPLTSKIEQPAPVLDSAFHREASSLKKMPAQKNANRTSRCTEETNPRVEKKTTGLERHAMPSINNYRQHKGFAAAIFYRHKMRLFNDEHGTANHRGQIQWLMFHLYCPQHPLIFKNYHHRDLN